LNNANELINGLRHKIAQQKEILGRAKQELSNYKGIKEKVIELQEENESLKKQLQIANNQKAKPSSTGSPAISIKIPASRNQSGHRISFKSPSLSMAPPPNIAPFEGSRYYFFQSNNYLVPLFVSINSR
jgi:hypothetical protein